MKKALFSMLIILLLLSLSYSRGYSEKESLILSVDEAFTLLKDLDPNIKVTAVKPSPVEGLWEVDIEAGGKKGLVYIDATKKYLVSGAFIAIQEKKNLTQERLNSELFASEPIRIGLTLGLTGKYRDIASVQMNGFRLWEADVNKKGGILGRKVQVTVHDDRSDPRTAVGLYEKMILTEKIDLVFGPY